MFHQKMVAKLAKNINRNKKSERKWKQNVKTENSNSRHTVYVLCKDWNLSVTCMSTNVLLLSPFVKSCGQIHEKNGNRPISGFSKVHICCQTLWHALLISFTWIHLCILH